MQRMYKQRLVENNGRPAIYGMTNSNPMGTHNWQSTMFLIVRAEDLLEAGRASQQLARFCVETKL